MKYLFMLSAILLILCSCSTTRVHFYTKGIEAVEVERIRTELKNQGYKVYLNTLSVPAAVVKPTVVYSPMNSNIGQVDALIDVLIGLGYANMAVEPMRKGNHLYTGNNVGIYLKSYEHVKDIAGVASLKGKGFAARCPNADGELILKENGTFIIELLSWNEENDSEKESIIEGSWEERKSGKEKQVLLTADDNIVVFKKNYFQRKSQYGATEGVALINVEKNPTFAGCDFVYTEIELPSQKNEI